MKNLVMFAIASLTLHAQAQTTTRFSNGVTCSTTNGFTRCSNGTTSYQAPGAGMTRYSDGTTSYQAPGTGTTRYADGTTSYQAPGTGITRYANGTISVQTPIDPPPSTNVRLSITSNTTVSSLNSVTLKVLSADAFNRSKKQNLVIQDGWVVNANTDHSESPFCALIGAKSVSVKEGDKIKLQVLPTSNPAKLDVANNDQTLGMGCARLDSASFTIGDLKKIFEGIARITAN